MELLVSGADTMPRSSPTRAAGTRPTTALRMDC